MGDLISRSALLNAMDERYKEKRGNVSDNFAEGFMQMEKLIKEQPTAYNVEKVAAGLEESTIMMANSKEFWDDPQSGKYVSEVIPIEKAIKIVRNGGVEHE